MEEYILITALVVSFVLHAFTLRWLLKVWGFQVASSTDLLKMQNVHAFAIVELFLRARKPERGSEYIQNYYEILSVGLDPKKKEETDAAVAKLLNAVNAGPLSGTAETGIDRLRQRLATLKNEGGPPLEQPQ